MGRCGPHLLTTPWGGTIGLLLGLLFAVQGLSQETFIGEGRHRHWSSQPPQGVLGQSLESFAVEGQVLTDQGIPPPTQVNLRLETSDGRGVVEQVADSQGHFRLIAQRGVFRLTVIAEGFETVQQPLRVGRGTSRSIATITLRSAAKAKPAGGIVSISELSAPRKARKACEKGERALQEGKLIEAQEEFQKAVELHPCYARAHTRLGITRGSMGDLAAAEKALKIAVECDARFLEAHVQLGVLLNHQQRYVESAAQAEEALKLFPMAWQLHYQLATAQYGLGRYREAERGFLKAQSSEATIPAEIHIRLANVYAHLRAYDKAYAQLAAYLLAEPEGQFATDAAAIRQRMESAGLIGSSQAQPNRNRSE